MRSARPTSVQGQNAVRLRAGWAPEAMARWTLDLLLAWYGPGRDRFRKTVESCRKHEGRGDERKLDLRGPPRRQRRACPAWLRSDRLQEHVHVSVLRWLLQGASVP